MSRWDPPEWFDVALLALALLIAAGLLVRLLTWEGEHV